MSSSAPARDGSSRFGGQLPELLLLAGARMLAAGAGLLSATLLARALGPADYGAWAMLVALQGQALLLADMGLRAVITADCGHDAGGVRRSLRRYLLARGLLAVTVAAAMLPVAAILVPGQAIAAGLLLSTLGASALLMDWIALARGHVLEACLPAAARPLLFAAGVAVLSAARPPVSLMAAATCLAAAWWLASLSSMPALRHLPPAAERSPLALAVLARRALPLGIAGIAAQALLSVDILLVGLLLGRTAAGTYQLATAVLVAGLVFANAAGQLTLARAGVLRDGTPAMLRPVLRGLGTITALGAGLASMAALLAPWAVPRVFGDPWAPAVAVLFWLLPWYVLQHAGSWLGGLLTALARERAVLGANLVALSSFVLALAAALWLGDLRLVALARGVAELARCASLVAALAGISFAAPASAGFRCRRAATSP